MTQLITNKGGGYMKIPSLRSIETVLRVMPVVKDLLPSSKAGLNSLINESEYSSKIKNLENAVHDKNAEIFKLRQERKAMKRLLFSNNKKITDLEDNVENCNYQINILQNALTKGE
jgi:hypothetical protein